MSPACSARRTASAPETLCSLFRILSATSRRRREMRSTWAYYPPPVYNGTPGPATVTPGDAQPNILMIMVDQLRSPRWLVQLREAGTWWINFYPILLSLREHSFNFPNYFAWLRPTAHPARNAPHGVLISADTHVC